MALSGGFPTTHCCCFDGSSSSKRNKVRNIFYSILARKEKMELATKVLFL